MDKTSLGFSDLLVHGMKWWTVEV